MAQALESPDVHAATFGQFLHELPPSRGGASDITAAPAARDYVQLCLLPMLATFFTASYQAVLAYPAGDWGGGSQHLFVAHHPVARCCSAARPCFAACGSRGSDQQLALSCCLRAVLVLDFVLRHRIANNLHTRHGSQDAVRRLSARAARVLTATRALAVHLGTGAPRSGGGSRQPRPHRRLLHSPLGLAAPPARARRVQPAVRRTPCCALALRLQRGRRRRRRRARAWRTRRRTACGTRSTLTT